jgi:tetratricopeptide (TPR) repeat protein
MYGDPKVALAHFQRAADSDPNYLLNFSLLDEGVWTYVGRAYYAMGKLPEAQQALKRARSQYEQDHLAKLYLGLVFMRDGDRQRGLRETEDGLRGLGDWLAEIQRNLQEGRFWDPGRELRREIQRSLATIKGRDINWAELIASGEWLGQKFEEEIDLAKRDEFNEETQDSDDDQPM